MDRAHVLISGFVQGVFFRSSVRARAKMLSLRGWVRNTSSGEVEALFEGDKDQIEKMLDYCREGPKGALVEDMKVEWQEAGENLTGFEIRE